MTSAINTAFVKLTRRAEISDRAKLVATFVDVGPLFTLISGEDHQILYGRRGTGKTHALYYLAETTRENGNVSVYIDMRTVGSTGGVYSDTSIPLAQRATRLLIDTLLAIHDGLYDFFVKYAEELDLSKTSPLLDRLADAITQVRVSGTVQLEEKTSDSSDIGYSSKAEFGVSSKEVKAAFGDTSEVKQKKQIEQRLTESGVVEHRIHFGSLGQVFREIALAMQKKRIWLLLDEWSSIPIELQPYLADLLRRSAFPVQNLTVKIAAIEQRSRFRISTDNGDYIGIELGADASADLNLDDFMVFDNDVERARDFFQELIFKHVKEVENVQSGLNISSSYEMIQQAFTQRNTFDELVRATEGVPRDAINILSSSAQKALNDRIAINDLNTAARNWYQRDKETAVKSNTEAYSLLRWIIDRVIGERRARAFLLKSDTDHELIDFLFDARVLHIVKRNISSNDQPGTRYDVYELDYGCYIDLKGTQRYPQGLLPFDDEAGKETYIDVPTDDYRAIRRAILDLDEYATYLKGKAMWP